MSESTYLQGRKPVREGDQQMPVPNDHPAVQQQVMIDLQVYRDSTVAGRQATVQQLIDDIEQRMYVGIQRYGTALQPWNGRDVLRDAYDEVLDLLCYLKQAAIEGHGVALIYSSARSVALELRAKIEAAQSEGNDVKAAS